MTTSVSLVTGASSGIGRAFALRLARAGRPVVLVARRETELEDLASELRQKQGIEAYPVALDLTAPGACERLEAIARERGWFVEDLVNNAGFGMTGRFATGAVDEIERMLALNVSSLTSLTRRFVPEMISRGRGRIVNVASTAAFQPIPYFGAYAATKAFVLSLSEALAEELRGTGVTVTCLCPGPTATEFGQVARLDMSAALRTVGLMTAEEVAEAGWLAMQAGERIRVPGWFNFLGTRFSPFAPRPVVNRLMRTMFGPGDEA